MSESSKPYQRLSRSRFGLNGFGSLWLGKDHVLLVNNTFAIERYRRWFLREIQAVIIRRNPVRLIWNCVLGVFAVLLLAAAGGCFYASSVSRGAEDIMVLAVMATILGVFGFAFVVVVAVNTSMGPGCTAFIQTPSGLTRLSTPNRVAAVEKLISRLQPQLVEAQAKQGDETGSLREIAAALDQPLS